MEVYHKAGDTIQTGSKLYKLDAKEVAKAPEAPKAAPAPAAPKAAEAPKAAPAPAAAPPKAAEAPKAAAPAAPKAEAPTVSSVTENKEGGDRRVKMTRMRLRTAERLKQSQETAASLTTFNEIDMKYPSFFYHPFFAF